MLYFLGPPRWQLAPDQPARRLTDIEARLLFTLSLQGPTRRRTLAAQLWPDSEPARAQANLRKRLQLLRRAAGVELIVGSEVIQLVPGLPTDREQAESALSADARAAGGELLQDVEMPDDESRAWLVAQREAWHQQLAALIEQQLAARAADGRAAAALPYAERLVALHPDDDSAWLRLVQLHHLAGDAEGALRAVRRCEAILWREDARRPPAALRDLAARIEQALAAQAPGLPGVPLLRRRPLRLVARDSELQRLRAAWQAGRGIVVSGEPGVGKTRLVGAFAAETGALLLELRPGDAAEPYGLVRRLLLALARRPGRPVDEATRGEAARLEPTLGTPAAGPTATPRLHEAVCAWLAQAACEGLPGLVVDDLQYADPASLELLLHAAEVRAAPWLLAVRAAEWPALLEGWMQQQRTGMAERLALAPLDADAVAELLREADVPPAQAERMAPGLWRHAGGNPYFVLQTLLEHGAQQPAAGTEAAWAVSPHLRDLVVRRLQRLSPTAVQLARAAALSDLDFSVELAARLLGVTELALAPAWHELEAAQLLRGTAFAHDIAREAVLSLVPEAIGRAIQRQLALSGAAHGIPASRRARHALAAGDDVLAVPALLQAAAEAERLSRRREEADWLDLAIDGLRRLGERAAWSAAMQRRVVAAHYVDRYDRQVQLAEAWLAAAESEVDRCRASIALATVHGAGRDPQAGERSAREAVALARAACDPGLERAAVRALVEQLYMGRREQEALAIALPHRDAAMASVQRDDALFVLVLADAFIRAGRPREALPLLRHVRRLARSWSDWGLLGEIEAMTGYALHVCAQVGRAAVCYRQGRETHRRTGSAFTTAMMHFIDLPRLYRELGRYGQSLAWTEEVRDEQHRAKGYRLRTNSDGDLAFLWQQLGQPARALQALGGDEPPGPDAYLPSWQYARARIEHWAGRDAAPLLREGLALVSAESQILRWFVGRDLALALPPEEGAALAAQLLAECEQVDCEIARWPLQVALADRLAAAGRTDAAAACAHRLLRGLGRRVMPSMHAPHAWWLVGRALQCAGDAAGAALAFGHGLRWIDGALPQVPAPFVDSFQQRNPWVAALLAWQARRPD